jgi:hypothetical protein
MHVLTGMHVRLTVMLGYRLLQIASVVHQPEPDTASDCTAAESGSTAVEGSRAPVEPPPGGRRFRRPTPPAPAGGDGRPVVYGTLASRLGGHQAHQIGAV